MPTPPEGVRCILEPFAGCGDLIDWVRNTGCTCPIEAYDIDPKRDDIQQRDTLRNPPDYTDAWVITNPPYLARNKSTEKELYDTYSTNDLYKCFILSLVGCRGGILIIPAGFFLSPRPIDVKCRSTFLEQYRLTKARYFEEQVFEDTTTTVVAIAFERSPDKNTEQSVEWESLPSRKKNVFRMQAQNDWIIGGEIYNLPVPEDITVRRTVENQPLKNGEQQTFMTLEALDTGRQEGRIRMEYTSGYVYPAKECSRARATLRITGKLLSEQEQISLCKDFNTFIEQKREETWSLFLPQYRESKEYARKRIPFELAYRIVLHLILANHAK